MNVLRSMVLCGVFCSFFLSKGLMAQTCEHCGIGTDTPGSVLTVEGCGDSTTSSALNVLDSTSNSLFYVRDDGSIGVGTTSPTATFDLRGDAVFNEGGGAYDVRVEGSNEDSLFLTDPAKNTIGMGTDAPRSFLGINGRGKDKWKVFVNSENNSNGAAAIMAKSPTPSGTGSGDVLKGEIQSGSGYATGLRGRSYRSSSNNSGRAYGVKAMAGNATDGFNYGVKGRVLGNKDGAAIFGTISGNDVDVPGQVAGYFDGDLRVDGGNNDLLFVDASNNAVGIGTTPSTYKLEVDGDAAKVGGGNWASLSDGRLKKDTSSFTEGLGMLEKFEPVRYRYRSWVKGGRGQQVGVIAQQVNEFAPYCIDTSYIFLNEEEANAFPGATSKVRDARMASSDTADAGQRLGARYKAEVLTYNSSAVKYILINSVKTLNARNQELKGRVDSLETELGDIKARLEALEEQ